MYHYDLQGRLIAETTVTGNLVRDYVYADDQPIAKIESGETVLYVHTDHLDTPRVGTNQSQNVVWRWEGNAFGDTPPTGSAILNLRFAGQYYDFETGLYYNNNRYYDPRIGRYVTSDPVGLAGGLNTYSYVYNSPLRYIDPSGLNGIETLYMPDSAPLVVAGRAFGGLAAYIEGLATDNQALANAALEGMADSSDANLEALVVLGTMGRGRASGGICPTPRGAKQFSKDKQALVDMAKADKRKGITPADMQAYKDLNKGLPDPCPSNKVRGPEAHATGGAHSQQPHGHVGPVHHIPIVSPEP